MNKQDFKGIIPFKTAEDYNAWRAGTFTKGGEDFPKYNQNILAVLPDEQTQYVETGVVYLDMLSDGSIPIVGANLTVQSTNPYSGKVFKTSYHYQYIQATTYESDGSISEYKSFALPSASGTLATESFVQQNAGGKLYRKLLSVRFFNSTLNCECNLIHSFYDTNDQSYTAIDNTLKLRVFDGYAFCWLIMSGKKYLASAGTFFMGYDALSIEYGIKDDGTFSSMTVPVADVTVSCTVFEM